jgi:hypothetical protein
MGYILPVRELTEHKSLLFPPKGYARAATPTPTTAKPGTSCASPDGLSLRIKSGRARLQPCHHNLYGHRALAPEGLPHA